MQVCVLRITKESRATGSANISKEPIRNLLPYIRYMHLYHRHTHRVHICTDAQTPVYFIAASDEFFRAALPLSVTGGVVWVWATLASQHRWLRVWILSRE